MWIGHCHELAQAGVQQGQDEQARVLSDEAVYTSLQAVGRLENALEEELGTDIDFATQLSPWQVKTIADLVQEAEALDFEGKTQEADEKAGKVIALAKKMLSQQQEATERPSFKTVSASD